MNDFKVLFKKNKNFTNFFFFFFFFFFFHLFGKYAKWRPILLKYILFPSKLCILKLLTSYF